MTVEGRKYGMLPRSATRLICGSDHAFVGFVGRDEGGSTPDERMKGSRPSLFPGKPHDWCFGTQ